MDMMLKFEFVVTVLYLYVMESFAIRFEQEPKSVVAGVGGTVQFKCSVDELGGHVVKWYSHTQHKFLSSGMEIEMNDLSKSRRSRYKITRDAANDETSFNFEISNLTVADNDKLSCLIYKGNSFLFGSKAGELTVYEPPDPGYPKCTIETNSRRTSSPTIGPGSWVTISCHSSGGTVPSRLDWKHRFEILPGNFVQSSQPTAYYAVRISEMDNGAQFTCVETNPALMHNRTCTITPFYQPTEVNLTENFLEPELGEESVFSCDVTAVPDEGLNYTWYVNDTLIPPLDENYLISVENNTLTIPKLLVEHNSTSVTCNVRNILGLEANDTKLLIINSMSFQEKIVLPTSDRNSPTGIIIIIMFIIVILICALIAFVHRKKVLYFMKNMKRSDEDEKRGSSEIDTQSTMSYERPLSSQSVVICATPRDAIKEHMEEIKTLQPVLERPSNLPILVPVNKERCRNSIARENGKTNISMPVGLVHHATDWDIEV